MNLSEPELSAPPAVRSVDEDVARLRSYIDQLERNGATRLAPEPKLGDELGVSRSRLRTILKRLEDEGLIWRHVGKGTFLGPRRQFTVDTSAVSGSISVHDFFEARLLLEPQLAALAAIHATPTDVAALENCRAEMASASSFSQWRRLDDKLHRTIAEATHNSLLLILYDALRSEVRMGLEQRMEEVLGTPPSPESTTDTEHQSFIEAIKRNNPTLAAKAMREHISSVRDSLFGSR